VIAILTTSTDRADPQSFLSPRLSLGHRSPSLPWELGSDPIKPGRARVTG